jgi:hypothetical protein
MLCAIFGCTETKATFGVKLREGIPAALTASVISLDQPEKIRHHVSFELRP